MDWSPEIIVAIGGIVGTCLLWLERRQSANNLARKDEVALLREEVARLHKQSEEHDDKTSRYEVRIAALEDERRMLIDDIAVLWQYDVSLRTLMIGAGIQNVPEPPRLRSGLWGRRKTDIQPVEGEPT